MAGGMDIYLWIAFGVLMTSKTKAMLMPRMQNGQNIPTNYQTMAPNMQSHNANMQSNIQTIPNMGSMPPNMGSMPPYTGSMPPNFGNMPPMPGMPTMGDMSSMNSMNRMNSMNSMNMPPMPGMNGASAFSSMLPGYPCDQREVPCQGDLVCRMVANSCFRPPCVPVATCIEPPQSSGASCQVGQPIIAMNRMTEMKCGPAGRCPSRTKCTIDAADNIAVCCWAESRSGQCPAPTGGLCAQLCVDDSSCSGEQKCCFNGCGRTCVSTMFGGNFPVLNPPMPGFQSGPPANALEGLQTLMRQNGRGGMSPMPNQFNMPSQNNQMNQWQQGGSSSNGMSFQNGQPGKPMFPPQMPGMPRYQPGMVQGPTSGGPGYPGDMSGFAKDMQRQFQSMLNGGSQTVSQPMLNAVSQTGSQPMFPKGQQPGFFSGQQTRFQQGNQQLFPPGPQSAPYQQGNLRGFPNNSQMNFQGSPNGFPRGYPSPLPGPPMSGLQPGPSMPGPWPPQGFPTGFPGVPEGPVIKNQQGFSQSSQTSTQTDSTDIKTSPRILIPGATLDKHAVLQDVLKDIVSTYPSGPSGPGSPTVQPATSPDGQNTSSSTDGSSVYPAPDGVWSPQTDSQAVNVTDTSVTSSSDPANVTDTGIESPGPDVVATDQFSSSNGPPPSTSNSAIQQNTGNLFPPTLEPVNQNSWQNPMPNPQERFLGPQPGGFQNLHQNQQQNQVKRGTCPRVYSVGTCLDTCQTDGDCLVTYKCCSLGPCKVCMHPKLEVTPRFCSFQHKMRGLC